LVENSKPTTDPDIRYQKKDNGSDTISLKVDASKKKRHTKRSKGSETETLFMQWENGSAPVGEVKQFYRFGKLKYYEKTAEGCIEITAAEYAEKGGKNLYENYRRADRTINGTANNDGAAEAGNIRDISYDGNDRNAAFVSEQTIGEKLRHDTGRSVRSSRGDRGGVSEVTGQEEPKLQVKEQYSDVHYHAGDLGKAEPYSKMGAGRDTGHFGTGTYFVGNEEKINDSYYGKRPHEKVDFSKYNLFKVKNTEDGYALHDFLRGVNSFDKEEYETLPASYAEVEKLKQQFDDIEAEREEGTDPFDLWLRDEITYDQYLEMSEEQTESPEFLHDKLRRAIEVANQISTPYYTGKSIDAVLNENIFSQDDGTFYDADNEKSLTAEEVIAMLDAE